MLFLIGMSVWCFLVVGDEPEQVVLPPVVQQDTPPPLPADKFDLNNKAIKWWPYKEGLAQAKKKGLPIFFLQYATWCKHCKSLAPVFKNSRIVGLSKHFVMIRVNTELDKVSGQNLVKGHDYIPCLLFLNANEKVYPVTAEYSEAKYAYFYSDDPTEMSTSMLQALKLHYK